ncbi:MAG: HlyD family secretion protein [Myxococcaceae bacterium]
MSNFPIFRQTVHVFPRENAPHLFNVSDPSTRRSYTFQDFEVSLARLLNGQRSLPEVVTAAQELGIPVSERGLSAFVAKLRAQGLLDEEGAGAPPFVAPWPVRETWPAPVREQFLEALRAYRNGKFADAERIVESLLTRNPDNGEARRLLESLKGKKNTRLFDEIFAETEASWAKDAISPPDPEELADLPGARSKVPLLIGIAVLGAIVGALFVPLPYELTGKATLVAAKETEIKLEQPLFVGQVVAKEGDLVKKGDPIAKLDAQKLADAMKETTAQVATADKALRKEKLALKGPKVVRARKIVALLEPKVQAATADRDAKKAGGGPALDAAEKKLARLTEGLTEAQTTLSPPAIADAEKKLKELTDRVELLKAQQLASTGLVAPESGYLGKLNLATGTEVAAGTVVGNIADANELKAPLELTDAMKKGLKVDQTLTFEAPTAGKVPGKITAVEPKPEALIQNEGGRLRPGSVGTVIVNAGTRSTLAGLLQ